MRLRSIRTAKGHIMRTCLCLAILIGAIGLGCRSKSPEQTDANKPAEPKVDKVAVTVNGMEIRESEIEKTIKPQLDSIAKQSTQLPPAVVKQYTQQFREQALEQLIRRTLLDEKVQAAGVIVTEEEVIGQITEIAAAQGFSLEDFTKAMEQLGHGFDEVKGDVRKQLARNRFMESLWAGKVDVTEEDAKKYYDENSKRFETPEQVSASHILIQPELTGADPNEAKAKARTKAEDLLRQIKEGADFAELAKANSSCPSAPRGGDLGFFPRGQAPADFDNAAFALEVGQMTDVVETEYGFHIIKVTDHKDAGVTSFEQARDDIIEQLTQRKQSDFAGVYIDSLKADAKIVYPTGE
ncbi:MAG: peptidylprolyl isomerase [Planctomycetota bacterium]